MGVAALTLCWLAGNAMAAARCAEPQDMTALQIAALQQQLMVAALTCHDVADYNRFVISHQPELQASDRALLRFFQRSGAQKGDDGYNAYKTKLANDSSLRSIRDGQFCPSADATFTDARAFKGSLAELVAQRSSRIATGYALCMAAAPPATQLADAAPSQPVRRAIAPSRERAVDPRAGHQNRAREDRDAAAQRAQDNQDFDSDDRDINDDDRYREERHYIPDIIDATPRYDPEYAAAAPPRARYDAGDNRDDGDDRLAANDARGEDRDDNDGPDRGDADRFSAFPPHTRLVRGPDGLWYLPKSRR
jgi:hypothetical protein